MSVRSGILVGHLSKTREAPNNVGLKITLIAEERGLVESKGDIAVRRYRLTNAGLRYLGRLVLHVEETV